MNCHNFGNKIILQLYGELNDKETTKLNRHLEKCPTCQLELERLRETRETFHGVEIVEPSPSSEAAVHRLSRENLTRKNSWLNRVGRFLERLAPPMPRPVTAGVGLLVLLLALSFYLFYEEAPFKERIPEATKEIAIWEDDLDETIIDLQEEIQMAKWAIQDSDGNFFDEEITNLEWEISYLSEELNNI